MAWHGMDGSQHWVIGIRKKDMLQETEELFGLVGIGLCEAPRMDWGSKEDAHKVTDFTL